MGAYRLNAIVLVAAVGIFGAIATEVVQGVALTRLDTEIAGWLHAHASEPITGAMLAISWLHGQVLVCAYAAATCAWLLRRREPWRALAVALAIPGGLVLNALVKLAFHRARPVFDAPLVVLDTWSFPSGHTLAATVLWGTLAASLATRLEARAARAALWLGAATSIALVAFSRIYLGAHYLSDVVAAMAEGVAWIALCRIAVTALQRRRAAGPRGAGP